MKIKFNFKKDTWVNDKEVADKLTEQGIDVMPFLECLTEGGGQGHRVGEQWFVDKMNRFLEEENYDFRVKGIREAEEDFDWLVA